MIIGIDAAKAAITNRSGVENFVYEVILNLKKIDQKNTYFLYTNKHLPAELVGDNFQEKYIEGRRFWNRYHLPKALAEFPPEVYFQPLDFIPKNAPKKSIAVIHDLASKFFPNAYSFREKISQKLSLDNITQRAEKIICISQSTKADLLKFYPEVDKKIEIVHLGYDHEKFHPIIQPKDILKLDEHYILCSGRIEERKNTLALVRAFFKAKKAHNLTHKLVLAGGSGYGANKVYNEVNNNIEFRKDVVMPGHISHDKLPDLIAGADLFAFPSLYEGFGLSLIEAMACGAVVLTSNTSSLPEVGDDSVYYIDPANENDIADGLYKALMDIDLRRELKKKAPETAKQYSWEKTARNILNILEKL
ncbi:MAG: glycosyltransferase family 1 protein [Candidatus Berkelbacteria bacterium]